jgi:lipopolysaccharide transport system ATP-binding protein
MQSVASSGRTVLVVSHNMGLIESLCRRAIWLERGRIQSLGRTHEVVTEYATTKLLAEPQNLRERARTGLHSFARFVSLEILSPDGTRSRDVKMGARVTLRMGIEADRPIRKPWVALQIRSQFDQLLSHIANREAGFELGPIEGNCTVTCHIESMNLLPDRYFVDLILADMSNTLYDRVAAASFFDVRSADVLGTGMPMGKEYGMVFFPTRWELTTVESNDSSRK